MSAASRNTIQRKLVLNVVKNSYHPTAENVYKAIKADYPDISLGTVYRNLSLLSDRGEILKIPVPGAADRFDYNVMPHYHVVCAMCGAFADVYDLKLSELDSEVAQKSGYTIMGHDLMFTGLCLDCQNKSGDQQASVTE